MKTRKLKFLVAPLLVIALVLGGCGTAANTSGNTSSNASTPSGSDAKKVTIGVVMPLTGSDAKFGQDSLNGVKLVAEMINAQGGIKSMGGAKIEVVERDSTSNPAQAAAAMQQLISTVHPLAVVGVYASALTITAAPMAEKAQVPLFTTSFADQLSSSGYKYLFQIPPVATAVGSAQLNYAIEVAKVNGKQIKNIGIIYENDAFGTNSSVGIKNAAQAAGLNVVLDEGYSASITDATPLARKVAATHPDVIFPVSYLNDGVLLMRALKTANVNVPVIAGVGGFVTPDFLNLAGPDIVNGLFSTDISSPDVYGEIGAAYEKKYGVFMSQGAHDNAVAVSIIAAALESKPAKDSAVLAETLHSMDFTSGLAVQMPGGHVKFSDQGKNTVIKPILVQWQNGKLVSVWPSEIAKFKPIWP